MTRERTRTALLFLLPGAAIYGVFVLWPISQSLVYSFFRWNGLTPLTDFVGLDNYQKLVSDPVIWKALGNNVLVIVWSLLTQLPLGLGLAILVTGKLKGTNFFRMIYFAPMMMSEVIIAVLWAWIYNPSFGLINSLLRVLGIGQFSQTWLGDPNMAIVAVLIVTTWRYAGFYMVIFIAAINGIPANLYEAARIDGASSWQLTRNITLPLLRPMLRTVTVLVIVGSLRFFDLVWVMTEGGPGSASEVLATYMYKQAFRSQYWGYGSAVAVLMFFIAFLLAVVFIRATRARQESALA